MPTWRVVLPLSLSLTLRGAGAFLAPSGVAAPVLLSTQRRALAARRGAAVLARPHAKNSLGLVLLLGGTAASGLALQLRAASGDGAQCKAGTSSSGGKGGDQAPGHRVGSINELPGGLVTTEHFFSVPLRHGEPEGPHIEVFVRELGLTKNRGDGNQPPPLLFLQGGPGFAAGRPVSADSGWVKRALQSHTVFLLDQRGTGRSTAVTWESLAVLGGADEQADYVACMRADSIVRDCEIIRKKALGPQAKWTLLGQSFGGFCVMTYLSLAPEGLQAAMLTGGLPPVDPGCTAEKVYRHTYKRAAARSLRFYQRYPQHVQTVRDIMQVLHDEPQPLPDGGLLTARRFQQLGLCLGGGSGLEHLHYLLENPWQASLPGGGTKGGERKLSFEFLKAVESESDFETSPMYALGHEAIYCRCVIYSVYWNSSAATDAAVAAADASSVEDDARPCSPTPQPPNGKRQDSAQSSP